MIRKIAIDIVWNSFILQIFCSFSSYSLLWRYSAKKVQGAAEKHYPTMSIDELCALPVAEIAAPDSALFMWATFPQLPEALRLIKAWGFNYKSAAFVWLKKNKKADTSTPTPAPTITTSTILIWMTLSTIPMCCSPL